MDMANITRRVAKKLADRLAPDERLTYAVLAEVAGTLGVKVVGMVVARRTTERSLKRSAEDAFEAQVGIASTFPSESVVLAATSKRVLVVPSNGMTFKDTAIEVPLGSVYIGEVAGKALARRVRLVFSDGSTAEVDVQRGHKLEPFVEAVGHAGI